MKNKKSDKNFWRYSLENDFEIIAGRTAEGNDELSMFYSLDTDYWFHVSGTTGSHVLLRHPEKMAPDKITLMQAASVAAWFSKARSAKSVYVTYTLAKNIKKEKGLKPGSVFVMKSKKIKVSPGLPDD